MTEVMNLTSKLYQRDVVEHIKKTDWVKGNPTPYVVEFDPTAACDLACPGCISEDLIALGRRAARRGGGCSGDLCDQFPLVDAPQ